MKTLLILLTLLLFSFSSFAKVKVEIIKANEATMSFEKPTLNKAVKHLKKIILSKKRFKGKWQKPRDKTLFNRVNEADGSVEYYKPKNFSVIIKDITDELAVKNKEKEDYKKEVKRLKTRIDQLEIDSDHKKLLKKLVKSCLNE